MTLVSIVGDFDSNVLPLFYHFKDEMSHHILIYDDLRHDRLHADKIITGTKNFITKNGLSITTHPKQIDEDSYADLHSLCDSILSFLTQESPVFVNISDGLANIVFTLINELQPKGVKFLSYDRFDNTYISLHPNAMTTPLNVSSMSIEEHFMLKDVHILAKGSLEEATMHEEEIAKLFELHKGRRDQFESASAFILKTPTGFLFEFYVYNLIKDLEYDDIALGVKVEDNYANTAFENEFDILVMKNNHLHMIECKARDDFNEESVSTFIYKLDSVRNTLDEDANMIFLTQDRLYNPCTDSMQRGHLSPYYRGYARRIFVRGTPVGNKERFLRDVDSIFALQTKDIEKYAPKDRLPVSQRSRQQEIINGYLRDVFGLDIDFFHLPSLAKVLNYKMHYPNDAKVYEAMKRPQIQLLLRRINRHKDESEIQMIYNYFRANVESKESSVARALHKA